MKKFKKSFRLLTFMLFCSLSMTTISHASQVDEPELVETFVINEFEQINELKEMSDEMLIDEGFTDEEIHEIRELNLEELIIERIKSSDEMELRNLGYTYEDLNLIEGLDLDEISCFCQ